MVKHVPLCLIAPHIIAMGGTFITADTACRSMHHRAHGKSDLRARHAVQVQGVRHKKHACRLCPPKASHVASGAAAAAAALWLAAQPAAAAQLATAEVVAQFQQPQQQQQYQQQRTWQPEARPVAELAGLFGGGVDERDPVEVRHQGAARERAGDSFWHSSGVYWRQPEHHVGHAGHLVAA